jgi:phosphoribosylanthranilate isomerase
LKKPKVKICGITNLADAEAAVTYGADALGFVFSRPSPRYIEAEKAQKIIASLPPCVTAVGVFTEGTDESIKAVVEQSGINLIQFHGPFPRNTIEAFSTRAIQVVSIRDKKSLSGNIPFSARAYLLDNVDEKGAGGTGTPFNWDWAIPFQKWGRIILAGGLTIENVRKAIDRLHPYAVDVCSGVEEENKKGKKDHDKLKQFIEIAKAVAPTGIPSRTASLWRNWT